MIWKYKQVLRDRDITPFQLQKVLLGKVAHTVPYSWGAKEAPKRLDISVLDKVMRGIDTLSAEKYGPVALSDLIERKA